MCPVINGRLLYFHCGFLCGEQGNQWASELPRSRDSGFALQPQEWRFRSKSDPCKIAPLCLFKLRCAHYRGWIGSLGSRRWKCISWATETVHALRLERRHDRKQTESRQNGIRTRPLTFLIKNANSHCLRSCMKQDQKFTNLRLKGLARSNISLHNWNWELELWSGREAAHHAIAHFSWKIQIAIVYVLVQTTKNLRACWEFNLTAWLEFDQTETEDLQYKNRSFLFLLPLILMCTCGQLRISDPCQSMLFSVKKIHLSGVELCRSNSVFNHATLSRWLGIVPPCVASIYLSSGELQSPETLT